MFLTVKPQPHHVQHVPKETFVAQEGWDVHASKGGLREREREREIERKAHAYTLPLYICQYL